MRLRRAIPVLMAASALFVLSLSLSVSAQDTTDQPIGVQSDGSVLVPSNQVLRPAGAVTPLAVRPVDMAVSPNGDLLAVVTDKATLLLNAETMEILANFDRTGRSVAGIAFSPDGSDLYYSIGYGSAIGHATIGEDNEVTVQAPIPLGDNTFPGALSISPDGSTLYVALFGTDSLGIVNLETGETTTADVGSTPFGAYVSPDGQFVYVSNWGGARPGEDSETDTSYPQIEIEPETGATLSGTVSVYDVQAGQVVDEIVVGLHPTAIAFNRNSSRAYVANSNADTISVIDVAEQEVTDEILVRPDSGLPFGSMPNALVVSADGSKLFVANGGNNAIAIVDLASGTVDGFIPTEWFPTAVGLSADGSTIYVANNKGQGSTNYLPEFTPRSVYSVTGSISAVPLPSADELADYTTQVDANSQYLASLMSDALQPARSDVAPVPVPERIGEPSVFQHVIYVIKENRTYDQILGDLEQANGDPNLATFGRAVTPNHHALAERFGILDNYFTSTINSADGHQWLNMAMANVFTERVFNYYPMGMYGSSSLNLTPTTLWSNVESAGLSQVNYGENTYATVLELQPDGSYAAADNPTWADYYEDFLDQDTERYRFELSYAAPPLTQQITYAYAPYPGWDMAIPDVLRMEKWLADFQQYVDNGNLPAVQTVYLPEDHTSGTADGFPTPAAHVADNDLALGQLVEAVSNSPYWENTVIFVVEDDSQDGLDHVDGHRSVAYCISPYSAGGVISTNYNQTSVVRTIEQILGLPPMNQFDLTATPMTDCFDGEPDLAPYTALVPDVPLDQMNAPMSTLTGVALNDAIVSTNMNWQSPDFNATENLNAIIWRATRPGEPVPTFTWQGESELGENSIAGLFVSPNQAEVTVSGIATTDINALGAGTFFIQDETGGVAVYVAGDNLPEITIGTPVEVTGTLAVGNDGAYVVQVADAGGVTIDGDVTTVAPMRIATADAPLHFGQLVQTEATLVNTTWYWGDDYLAVTSADDLSTGVIGVYLPGAFNTGFATGTPSNGETVCITGIVRTFNLGGDYYVYGLAPRSSADLAMGACSQ